jgi:hypothetical protein
MLFLERMESRSDRLSHADEPPAERVQRPFIQERAASSSYGARAGQDTGAGPYNPRAAEWVSTMLRDSWRKAEGPCILPVSSSDRPLGNHMVPYRLFHMLENSDGSSKSFPS